MASRAITTSGTNESVTKTAAKPTVEERFPWERLEDEPPQAYQRFLEYRTMSPGERSMRKVSCSGTLAFRWSRKWQWVKRTCLYDAWICELSDKTANHAVLRRKSQLVRLSSVLHNKTIDTVLALDSAKQSADDVATLVEAGLTVDRQAFGLSEPGPNKTAPGTVVQVGVAWPTGGPAWLTKPEPNASRGQIEQNIVVPCGEQVIAENTPSAPLTPVAKVGTKLIKPAKISNVNATGVSPVRLIEKVVKGPVSG